MRIRTDHILRRVEEVLREEGGARVVHDFLEGLASDMEELRSQEIHLRKELTAGLTKSLGRDVPEVILDVEGPDLLIERLKQMGIIDMGQDSLPKEALELWETKAGRMFAISRKRKATDSLINDIVERMYGVSGISETS